MKKYILLLAGIGFSALMVACGAGSSDANGNTAIIQCPIGTAFQNGNCVNGNGIVAQTGSVGFYSDNWTSNTLQKAGGNGFREFLKNAMGVCDRAHSNGGLADCNAWLSSSPFDIAIQAPTAQSNALQVTFRVGQPRSNSNGWYSYQLPSGRQLAAGLLGFPMIASNASAYRPVLQLNMAVSVTNNYQGFEARGYGDFYTTANRSLIQVQIAKGKLEDQRFDYRIAYRGEIIVTGTFVRCNTVSCGLDRPIGY